MITAENTVSDLLSLYRAVDLAEEAREYLHIQAGRCISTCDWMATTLGIKKARILDVGCGSILTNSVLLAAGGADVTALDMAEGLCSNPAKQIAEQMGISLLPCNALESLSELAEKPPNSFDVVLFSEVIEHITFNPIEMWTQLCRVLRPGGRIVVTTPNYHALSAARTGQFFRDVKNMVLGRSSGLRIERLLEYRTYSHHWKEYSAKDISTYFSSLSPDLCIQNLLGLSCNVKPGGVVCYSISNASRLLPTTADNLLLDIRIIRENASIRIVPHW